MTENEERLLAAIKPFADFEKTGWYIRTFHENVSDDHPVLQVKHGKEVTQITHRNLMDALRIYNELT